MSELSCLTEYWVHFSILSPASSQLKISNSKCPLWISIRSFCGRFSGERREVDLPELRLRIFLEFWVQCSHLILISSPQTCRHLQAMRKLYQALRSPGGPAVWASPWQDHQRRRIRQEDFQRASLKRPCGEGTYSQATRVSRSYHTRKKTGKETSKTSFEYF